MTRPAFPTPEFSPDAVGSFVACWSRGYDYPAEEVYTTNIGRPLTGARLRQLFEWKNGGPLSASKRASIEKNYINRLPNLHELSHGTPPEDALRRFGGGAIWSIFFLHCWQPLTYPIYDQHVHRAMEYIQTGSVREIRSSTTGVHAEYLTRYVPFWSDSLAAFGREADKALWVFGKFLKRQAWLLAPDRSG